MTKLEISLQPKQEQLLDLLENGTARWIGYGGAKGGGKSYGARATHLWRRFHYANTPGLIFRRTLPELQRNHIKPIFRDWPFLRDWYSVQEKLLTFPHNGSTVQFVAADDERSFGRIQGAEFADIDVDEATQNTQEELEWLGMHLRCTTNQEIEPRMVLTMNPGGRGHGVIKRLFIDRDYHENERPEDYTFLQAHGHDNVEWARKSLKDDGLTVDEYYEWPESKRFEYFITRTDYGKSLNSLPKNLRDAYLLGRWDVFAGQYFDIFDPARHVITMREAQERIKPWHVRWLSGDWGFHDEAVILWHTLGDEGVTITYREMVLQKTTPIRMGEMIADATPASEGKFSAFNFSPDAFGERNSPRTIADEISSVLRQRGLPPPSKADNEREGGWALMYQLLESDKWIMTENCRRLIESLPQLQRCALTSPHPNDIENEPHEFTNAPEAARYGLKTFLKTARVPIDLRVKEAMWSKDPTIAMVQGKMARARLTEESKGTAWRAKRRGYRMAR